MGWDALAVRELVSPGQLAPTHGRPARGLPQANLTPVFLPLAGFNSPGRLGPMSAGRGVPWAAFLSGFRSLQVSGPVAAAAGPVIGIEMMAWIQKPRRPPARLAGAFNRGGVWVRTRSVVGSTPVVTEASAM